MSLSLHSSTEYLGGSNRWSRNERDMVPEKSSIGLISSKISSRPDCSGTSLRPTVFALATRRGPRVLAEALREANRGPSELVELVTDNHRTHAKRPAGTPWVQGRPKDVRVQRK